MTSTPTRSDLVWISDLHLGDGSGSDDFGPRNGQADKDLRALCAMVRRENRCIGIAGDLFELLQSTLDRILRAHGPAIEALASVTEVYVVGNHDEDMLGRMLYGMECLPYWIDVPKSMLVIHGHQVDGQLAKWPKTTRALSRVFGFFERVIHPDCDEWAEGLEAWLDGTGRHGANAAYVGPLATLARELNCRRVVFGHVHKFECGMQGPGGVRLDNCGTWCNGNRDVLSP